MADAVSLTEAAEVLDVHYMTAYRYVRIGQLPATKVGGRWRVLRRDLESFGATPRVSRSGADWDNRLYARLVQGDEPGAWSVIESAMASAHEPTAIYLEVVCPAMRRIGAEWAEGSLDIATEHRASAIVMRLIGRLGAVMRPRGRRKGEIVLGSPTGERHSLPLAIVGDMFRAAGYEVTDLGADVPAPSFGKAIDGAANIMAVGIGISNAPSLSAARSLIASIREDLAAGVPIIVGGAAVKSAQAVGADFAAKDGIAAVEFVETSRGR